MVDKKKRKNLEWYWLSLVGAIGIIVGTFIGGAVGSLIAIFGGYLFLLFSIAEAVRGGIKGTNNTKKVTANSRIGGFIASLGVAFVALVISGYIVMVTGN